MKLKTINKLLPICLLIMAIIFLTLSVLQNLDKNKLPIKNKVSSQCDNRNLAPWKK